MHDDPCDNHDGAFDTGPKPKPTGPEITYRISFMLRAKSGEPVHRTQHVSRIDDMATALAEWKEGRSDRFVIACTISDHPAMWAPVDA